MVWMMVQASHLETQEAEAVQGHQASKSQGVFDDILKLVCQLMENGSTEPEAQTLICSKLHYSLEVQACDKVIDLLWKGFENKECPAGAKPDEAPEKQFERFVQKFNKNYRDENERR